jgi:hypothetical protein
MYFGSDSTYGDNPRFTLFTLLNICSLYSNFNEYKNSYILVVEVIMSTSLPILLGIVVPAYERSCPQGRAGG